MRSPRSLVTSLAALAVLAAACGGGGGGTSEDPSVPPTETGSETAAAQPTAPSSDPVSPSPADPASVNQLWAFEAEQVTGGTFEGSSLSGRDVAVWFWAPW